MTYSLIGRYIPFIVLNNQAVKPFVHKNIPIKGQLPVLQPRQGFTLIELVVAMAVAAILVGVAVPNMRTFIQNGRLNTQVNDLLGDLNFARSEAIKRRVNVGITTSPTGACATGGNWRNGRLIFIDTNNNSICDATDTVLRFREALSPTTNTLTTVGMGDPVFFGAGGASPNIPAGALGSFTFCDDRSYTKGKQINMNSMGQATVKATAPSAC